MNHTDVRKYQTVKVVARSAVDTWGDGRESWVEGMDEFVGRIGCVRDLDDYRGVKIAFNDDLSGWWFPAAVVELV